MLNKAIVVLTSLFIVHLQAESAFATDRDAVSVAMQFVNAAMMQGDIGRVEPLVKKGATRKRGKPGSLLGDLRREQKQIQNANPLPELRLREIYLVRDGEQEHLKDRILRHMRQQGRNVTEEEADVPADVIAKAYGMTKDRTICMLFYERRRDANSVAVNLVLLALEEIDGRFLVAHVWDG